MAGNVLNVELKMDKDSNKFRGLATVRFEHPLESVQAICILYFDYCPFTMYEAQSEIAYYCILTCICCTNYSNAPSINSRVVIIRPWRSL